MENSQILLNHGLTFLASATGIIVLIVGAFLAKLIYDLAKLTRNVDTTTTDLHTELKPTITELNETLHTVNNFVQSTDKQMGNFKDILERFIGSGNSAMEKAKKLSGGLLSGLVKGIGFAVKLFGKKK